MAVKDSPVTQTEHIVKTLEPTWNHTCEARIDIKGAHALEFALWDYDMLSGDDMMGFATVSIIDAARSDGGISVRAARVHASRQSLTSRDVCVVPAQMA